ncbi:MAG TPA: hypothetical protein V6C86_11295 [Oculatellaceae cyanobacterium]
MNSYSGLLHFFPANIPKLGVGLLIMAFENSAEQYKPSEVHQRPGTAALLPSNHEYQQFFKPASQTGSQPGFLDFGQTDIYSDKTVKLAQDIQVPMMPNLVPGPEQLGITKETTIVAAEIAWKLGTALSKEHPIEGQEEGLMAATTASDPKAWEHAASNFPQLADVSPSLMKAYVRNELAFYGREDLAQDIAASAGESLGITPPTLGMAQITVKGIDEFEKKYPQFRAFLESKGYSGPGHEMRALLDPECVPMIVAAKTASLVDDLHKQGIEHPTLEQLAYAYNPDVYSYSDGHGGHEYKTLYQGAIYASKAQHWDQQKEYYAKDRNVWDNSDEVRNVLSWLNKV